MAEEESIKIEIAGMRKDFDYMKDTLDRIEKTQAEVINKCIKAEEFANWKNEVEELKDETSTKVERSAYNKRLERVEKLTWAIMWLILAFVLLGIMGTVLNFAGIVS